MTKAEKAVEYVSVPREPTEAMLRPFYECPPDELKLAWEAMLCICAAAPAEQRTERVAETDHKGRPVTYWGGLEQRAAAQQECNGRGNAQPCEADKGASETVAAAATLTREQILDRIGRLKLSDSHPHSDVTDTEIDELRDLAIIGLAARNAEPVAVGEVVAFTGSMMDMNIVRWSDDYRPKIGDKLCLLIAAPKGE